MDPVMLALIFAGVRLASQAATGTARQRDRLADFEAFLLALHTEGRAPTMEEAAGFVTAACRADDGLAAAIDRLKAAAEGS